MVGLNDTEYEKREIAISYVNATTAPPNTYVRLKESGEWESRNELLKRVYAHVQCDEKPAALSLLEEMLGSVPIGGGGVVSTTTTTVEKKRRSPNEYNKFVSQAMRTLTAANPSMPPKQAMANAVAMWTQHKTLPTAELKELMMIVLAAKQTQP